MDIKTTFLNAVIEEDMYIEQPEGFETHERRTHVCKLKKALYELKSAPRAWYGRINTYLQQTGFVKSDANPNLYYLMDCRPMSMPMITNWKKIDASDDKDVDPTLYRQLIEFLMYLVNTMPYICFRVNTLNQFMVEPKRVHWAAVRYILSYIHNTVEYGLKYTQEDDVRLSGYTNADWAGSSVDRKSTSGYCFSVGSGMVSWCSRKEKSVALSSAEVEYMAANTTTCESIWLWALLVSLFRQRMDATSVYCDNQSCINLSENPVFHDRSKHIDIQCHFIRDCVQGAIKL
eukprot:PITA_02464